MSERPYMTHNQYDHFALVIMCSHPHLARIIQNDNDAYTIRPSLPGKPAVPGRVCRRG